MADQKFNVEIDFVAKNKELFDKANKESQQLAQSAKSIKNAYALYRDELQKLNPELVKQLDLQKQQAAVLDKEKQAARELTAQIRNMRAEAKEIRTSVALLKDSADDLDRIAKPLFAGGAAVVGGIFAFANKYVNDAKQATQTTREWKAAQDDLNRSGQRIGEVLATQALPVLKDVAKITSQVAGFLERNPEVASVALKAGLISLALGTIGKAVSSGIRLVADLKLDAALTLQNRAAQLQLIASENQLRAAGIQAKSSVVPTKATGGGGSLVSALTTGPIALAGIGSTDKLSNVGKGFADNIIKMTDKIVAVTNKLTGLNIGLLGASGTGGIGGGFRNAPARTPDFLGGSQENQDKAVKAFADWRAEDARIVQEAMDERKQIVADGEKAIVDIARNYTSQRTNISAQFSREAAQITTRYQQETQKAEIDYQRERAQITLDGNNRIREIQQDEQEKREKIQKEFLKASAEAAADRDALALVQAQEARDEALAEADQGTNEAIQRERRETQARLQELAARYAYERQQRQQQYEADLKENAARRAAALKEAADRYQQELKQAREATAQKLKEAAEAANRERIEKRLQFNATLADLGIVLNSERQLRNNAYNAMLIDLQNWLTQMGGAFSTSTTTTASSLGTASGGTTASLNTNPNFTGLYGTHDYSGYAYKGVYKMAQDGKPEWVMSGEDTRAAERAVGGQLTQGSVSQMIEMFSALRGASVNYAPNINSDVSARTRRDMEESFNRSLNEMLGRY